MPEGAGKPALDTPNLDSGTRPASLNQRPPGLSFLGWQLSHPLASTFLPSAPLPSRRPRWCGTEGRAARHGELRRPSGLGSAIGSKAGNRASSPSSEVYSTITANYLCYSNLCFMSRGKVSTGLFSQQVLLFEGTGHSISPERGHFMQPPLPSPAAWEHHGAHCMWHVLTRISKGRAWAQTWGRRRFSSAHQDLCSFPWLGGPSYCLPE